MDPAELWRSLPVITRGYVSLCVITTAACALEVGESRACRAGSIVVGWGMVERSVPLRSGLTASHSCCRHGSPPPASCCCASLRCPQIITPFNIYFNAKLIWQQHEYWRLFTNFFYFGSVGACACLPCSGCIPDGLPAGLLGCQLLLLRHVRVLFRPSYASIHFTQHATLTQHAGLDFFFHMFFLVKYSKSLEEGSFRSRAADFLWMLLFGAGVLVAAAPWVNIQFLGSSLTFMMVRCTVGWRAPLDAAAAAAGVADRVRVGVSGLIVPAGWRGCCTRAWQLEALSTSLAAEQPARSHPGAAFRCPPLPIPTHGAACRYMCGAGAISTSTSASWASSHSLPPTSPGSCWPSRVRAGAALLVLCWRCAGAGAVLSWTGG